MNQALYRKYRSKNLSEVVGQDHITTTLSNALKQGKISHAYLFTGPRGVGKTSIARILAHEINKLPYSDESTHLDIIEIDAASNRRIDEIRDLREKIHISPTSAKYKVYIIDEVHMLTKEAFNALLKTLEEPPAHVVFILATTEAHKLPETIISRTQRYHFNAIEPEKAVEHLKAIAEAEGFKVDEEALQLIAENGEGSFRDSIGLLDQVANGKTGNITAEDVRQATGHAPKQLITQLAEAVSAHSQADVLQTLQQARAQGVSPKPLAHQLIGHLRAQTLNAQITPQQLELMQALLAIEQSTQPDVALELILLKASFADDPAIAPITDKPEPELVETPKVQTPKKSDAVVAPQPEQIAEPEPIPEPPMEAKKAEPEPSQPTLPEPAKTPKTKNGRRDFNQDIWISLLASVKSSNPSLYSVLRMADAQPEGGGVALRFKHTFHAKRLNEARNQLIVADLLKTLLGDDTKITASHDVDAQPTATAKTIPAARSESIEAQQEPDPAVATILETFGGGELVET